MIQLQVVSGKKAGAALVAGRFPVSIGRAPNSDLRSEEDGVWERHLEIDLRPDEGFILTAQPGALVALNGQPIPQAVLRNGDLIELGALQIRFALSPTQQRSLRLRETLTWLALGLLCAGQIALIYWMRP